MLAPEFLKVRLFINKKIDFPNLGISVEVFSLLTFIVMYVCQQVGLPLLSFVLLGTYGLQQLLASKYSNLDRKKTYLQPESPEEILKVRLHILPIDIINTKRNYQHTTVGRKFSKSWHPKSLDQARQIN